MVTAIGAGTAGIVARAGSAADTATVVVLDSPMFLQLTPSAVMASAGDTVQFDAFLMRSNGTIASNAAVQWMLSDSAAATLVRDGVVETRSPGDVTVVAKSGTYTAEATVRVKEPSAASITISPAASNTYVGSSVQLTAAVRDDRGKSLKGQDPEWSSSNPSVLTVDQNGLARGVSPGGAIVTARANSRSASATVNVASPPAASVILTLNPDVISAPSTVQAVATPLDSSGNALAGKRIAWQSSNPAVATINSTGLITGVVGGATTISAIVDANIASRRLTVSSAIPTSVAVLPDPARITVGSRMHLTSEVRDQAGNAIPGSLVSWNSLTPNVASVSSTGDVTGVALGSALIKATGGTLSYTATVSVEAVAVASVAVTPASISLAANGTSTLTAIARDSVGSVLTGRPVSWSSSNPTTATVSPLGVVTALAAGVASITANIEGKTASASVNAAAPPPAPVASITVAFNSPSVSPGQSTQASAHVYDAQGNTLSGHTVSWSSHNPTLASVSSTGSITAISPGSVAITAQSDGVTGAATLLIGTSSPAPVATVDLSATKTALVVGETTQLTLTLRDLQGNVLTGRTIAYASSNSSVATVSVTGLVTAVSAGSTTISATSEGKSGSLGFTSSSVSSNVSSVTVQLGSSSLTIGQGTQATAVVLDNTGHPAANQTVTWGSTAVSLASVNSTGYVSALSVGSAQITATAGGKSGSAALTVQSAAPPPPPPPTTTLSSVSVSLNSPSITVGQSTQAVASALDASSAAISGATCNWSISTGQLVATVAPSSGASVLVSGASEGSATVSAACTYNGVSKSGSAVLVVSTATVTPITLPNAPATFTVTYPAKTGVTRIVNAGGDLQAAINAAQRGDEIVLQAGATFEGNFILPVKSGTVAANGWVTIRSSNLNSLPAGTRVTPANTANMPLIRTPDYQAAIAAVPGSSGWWLAGLEIDVNPAFTSMQNYGIVLFGGTQSSLSEVPSDLVMDRVYVHGSQNVQASRGLALNSARSAIIDSYISEIHGQGFDTQAIAGWNGPGPFKIVNNTLIAAGENILFGGADNASAALNPSDIEIRRNYVYKPPSWFGSIWQIKNLFELKNAQRVLVEGNVFDGNWGQAQSGMAFIWWSMNQSSTAPWSKTVDVTFRYNILRNSVGGLNLAASGYGSGGGQVNEVLSRVLIEQNIFEEIATSYTNGDTRMMSLFGTVRDLTIRDNSMSGGPALNSAITMADGPFNVAIQQNAFHKGQYGFIRIGNADFRGGFSGSVTLAPNAIFAQDSPQYFPNGTVFFPTLSAAEAAGFGANRAAVLTATAGVVIR